MIGPDLGHHNVERKRTCLVHHSSTSDALRSSNLSSNEEQLDLLSVDGQLRRQRQARLRVARYSRARLGSTSGLRPPFSHLATTIFLTSDLRIFWLAFHAGGVSAFPPLILKAERSLVASLPRFARHLYSRSGPLLTSTTAGRAGYLSLGKTVSAIDSSVALAPGARLTATPTRSPSTSSGTGTAHASATRSSCASARSTSALGMFSPPRMMMSFARSLMARSPSASM